MKFILFAAITFAAATLPAREAKLTRYPSYSNGRVAFTFLADIWVADENGKNVQRITANAARDVYPKFSPDGKWIAFSSDRNGNLDVFLVPSTGGQVKQLTFHSADDSVLGWSPDSQRVLFSSQRGEDFMAKLYTVSVDGRMEQNAGPDMGLYASFSPDGKKIAVNRKGQSYWRKYYRGSYQTDITVMDIASKTFKDLTDFNGMDSWPMWARDGHIYFVSDRENGGLSNIWRVPENGGKAQQVTTFKTGDVRWPSISADGKVIVFEHDFGVWKLEVASKKTTPLKVDIEAETQDNLSEVRNMTQLDDYSLAPSGRRIVFSTHGEIFSAPVDEGDLRQLTDNPARDKDPMYSPDGKWISFISDRDGREEIYVIPSDGTGDAKRVTDLDNLKSLRTWSPDSKQIAFTTSDNKLMKHSIGGQTVELTSSRYGNLAGLAFSPDGKWIAYSKLAETRTTDIYLIPSEGGQERKVTFDSYGEFQPKFSRDGKKLYFIRNEGGGFGPFSDRGSSQLFVVSLEKQEKDPDEADDRPDTPEAAAPGGPGGRRGGGAATSEPAKEVAIDWDGLKRRTKQITRMPFSVFNYQVSPEGRTLVFVTTEPAGLRSTPVVYSIQDDGKRLSRIFSGAAGGDDDAGGRGRGGRGGFGGGINTLEITRDGRTLFFQESGAVYSINLPATGGGAAAGGGERPAAASPFGGTAQRRRVPFTAKVKVNKPAEWAEMFGDAWRTMKYRFYDPKMHGMDWDQARSKYQPLVEFVGERNELINIINEMIGELNASHTGAAAGFGGRGEGAASTGNLGVELVADEQAGRYKVTHIYENGPADKDWVKVKVGDYLLDIDGTPVLGGDNYWKMLNYRLNRKVTLTLNSKPNEEGAWKTRIEPVTAIAFNQLRYERWVKQRKDMVEKLSGGKVGYLHIQAMDQPSLKKFEKEIRENRDKKALVIDQRFNGGGNIEQELLAILVQRQYQMWQPRGTDITGRPFAGYFGPKIVLQNWRSASNAEMFPAGFRALGLGKVVGTPTMGAVIGTGSYSLIDGSTVRTPGVGVYLADAKTTNMENYGVKPDVFVENTPEDNLNGRDRQLETAVAELMKEVH